MTVRRALPLPRVSVFPLPRAVPETGLTPPPTPVNGVCPRVCEVRLETICTTAQAAQETPLPRCRVL